MKPTAPKGGGVYIDVHFPFHALQNKSAKQAFSVSAGIFKGLSSKRVTEKMTFPQDKENWCYSPDEVNEKKLIPLCNLPNYESTAKVQFWLESSVVKNTNKSIWWGGFFSLPFGFLPSILLEYHP